MVIILINGEFVLIRLSINVFCNNANDSSK